MSALHWIGTVSFELGSSDSQALDPIRSALRHEYEVILVQPLQRALDLVDRRGRALRRRRIEIDLGRIGPGDFGHLLERRIDEVIRIELGGRPDESLATPGPALEDQLIAFLESGHLNWPSPGKALEAICTTLAGEGEPSLSRLASRLAALFGRRAETAGRFTRQCPLGLVGRIAAILAKSGKEAVPKKMVLHPTYARDEAARLLSAFILRLVRGEPVPDEERQCFEVLIAGEPWVGSAQTADGSRAARMGAQPPKHARQADPPPLRLGPRPKGQEQGDEIMARPAVHCLEAAGTILIHPFIARLFEACGLLNEEGGFVGGEERCRAVLLLQLAATGECEAPEPELALAKLLCGMDLKTPIPRSFEASGAERREVDAMLRAAIAHWRALGDSSPEALRETFLRRPGRLSPDREDWRLEVEARGVDILLDRLPWSVGIVLTPFMARPLRVQWR